jgi:hypothetical protein
LSLVPQPCKFSAICIVSSSDARQFSHDPSFFFPSTFESLPCPTPKTSQSFVDRTSTTLYIKLSALECFKFHCLRILQNHRQHDRPY